MAKHNITTAALHVVTATVAADAILAVTDNILRGIEGGKVPPVVEQIMRNDVAEFRRLALAVKAGEKPLKEFLDGFTAETNDYLAQVSPDWASRTNTDESGDSPEDVLAALFGDGNDRENQRSQDAYID